jgi:uncharacterized protein DUF4340
LCEAGGARAQGDFDMADAMAIRRDPKRRQVYILLGATAVALALATAAVFQQSSSTAPQFQQHPFFPGFSGRLEQLGEIAITAKTGSFHVRLQQGKWVIPERSNFPADSGQVRSTALGLADLTVLEPKTGRADWLSYVGLIAPDKGGDAVDVKLSDNGGAPIGELLAGHIQGAADDLGRNTLYVRHPDENQSWLARGSLTLKSNVTDWLDRNVLNIARDRIKGASVTPEKGPSYNLARDSKDQPDFKLLDMPAGRALSFDGSPDGVAGAIASFTFDDVAKADQFDFSKAPLSVEHTFDGLDLTVKIATRGMEHWAMVAGAASDPKVQDEASRINASLGGWAFKLSDDKVQQFVADRETLLKPLDTPKPAAPSTAPAK